ncbi:MAG: hypothetical protein WAO02_08940 [Verrucomicrobiia bacterium]
MSPSHKWLGYFQVQRSHAGNGKRGRNLDGGFLPNAATPKRTGRALRNSQFAMRNCQGFFSGIHFGMDGWGNWCLNSDELRTTFDSRNHS